MLSSSLNKSNPFFLAASPCHFRFIWHIPISSGFTLPLSTVFPSFSKWVGFPYFPLWLSQEQIGINSFRSTGFGVALISSFVSTGLISSTLLITSVLCSTDGTTLVSRAFGTNKSEIKANNNMYFICMIQVTATELNPTWHTIYDSNIARKIWSRTSSQEDDVYRRTKFWARYAESLVLAYSLESFLSSQNLILLFNNEQSTQTNRTILLMAEA